jgi:hypothetical protein
MLLPIIPLNCTDKLSPNSYEEIPQPPFPNSHFAPNMAAQPAVGSDVGGVRWLISLSLPG